MIKGFRLKITKGELRTHCIERGNFHAQRAELKETKQMPELVALKEATEKVRATTSEPVDELAQMSKLSNTRGYNFQSSDPQQLIDSLEADIRNHRNKALVFKFFAEHLWDEDYDLDEGDLQRLEIISRWS